MLKAIPNFSYPGTKDKDERMNFDLAKS